MNFKGAYLSWRKGCNEVKVFDKKIISQFCRIGKDCDWSGDRLSKNDENTIFALSD